MGVNVTEGDERQDTRCFITDTILGSIVPYIIIVSVQIPNQ